MLQIIMRINKTDNEMIEIFERNKRGDILWCVSHCDIIYDSKNNEVYDRLKQGEEITFELREV